MADQPLTELALPDAGPALTPLPADDDSRLKTDLIDQIFGVSELAAPEPEPSRSSLRTSLEEEPPAANLESVALNLEHALSEVFGEVEGSSASTPAGGEEEDGDGEGDAEGADDDGNKVSDGSCDKEDTVSNSQAESPDQPESGDKQGSPAAAAEEDDEIVVLDEITPAPAPSGRRKGRLLGPASRRLPGPADRAGGRRGLLRGPASRRPDFAQLGLPSSRMPPTETVSSDSEIEVEHAVTREEMKMMAQARYLRVRVSLRLNNVCLETSQTARQWAVTLQQRRDARKRHWEEVRRGPRPQPSPRRSSRVRARGRHAARPPAAALTPPGPVNFAATKQLMSLINRGVLQMNSVGSPPPVNGRARGALSPRSRGRAMVQIPAGSVQQSRLPPAGRARSAHPYSRGVAPAASLSAIPELGEKQRTQLMKLLQGNNGTSISPAPAALPRRATRPVPHRATRPVPPQPAALPRRATRPVPPRPTAPPPPPPRPRPPAPPPPERPEPERPRHVPEYCRTTSGSPDDLFSVYLSGKQQPEKCFVSMQINNHCLKVRLPARPAATGMVFAQVTRRSMEPICDVVEGSCVFIPPAPDKESPVPALASRPGPKSLKKPPPKPSPQPPQPVVKPSHPCSKCSQRFPTAAMLEYHFSVYHAQVRSQPSTAGLYECPLCKQWSGNLQRMREHITLVHAGSGRYNYTCAVCRRAWGRRTPDAHGQWLRHVLSHARQVSASDPDPGVRRRLAARRTEPTRPSRPQPAPAGQFSCPQCDAVFPDVSKFPEHWLKAHSGGRGPAAPARPSPVQPPPARAPRPPAGQGGATRQRANIPRDKRFMKRFEAGPARAAAAVTSAAAAAPAGGGSLRCTRCLALFPNEAAYAQHWINAHTRIRLSADQQAGSRSAEPPPPAVSADSNGDTAAMETDQAGGTEPTAMETDQAAGGTEPTAMDVSGPGGDTATGDAPGAAAGDAPGLAASGDLGAAAGDLPGEAVGGAAVLAAGDAPGEAAGDAPGAAAAEAPGAAAAATENGVSGGAEPDPAEEVANLVPSDADFEMSEETLDKMLEQIVPMKKRK